MRDISLSIPPIVSNSLTRLTSAFVADIDPEIDVRIQLLWNFGPFLEYIPCRLGVNESLDAAVEALLTAYMSFRAPQSHLTELCLRKYCRALKALQYCLADPEKAQSSETLCSTMLLLIYEVKTPVFPRDMSDCWLGLDRFTRTIIFKPCRRRGTDFKVPRTNWAEK
jgi:hypothetical protein